MQRAIATVLVVLILPAGLPACREAPPRSTNRSPPGLPPSQEATSKRSQAGGPVPDADAMPRGAPEARYSGSSVPSLAELQPRDWSEARRLLAAREEREEALIAWLDQLVLRDKPRSRREIRALIGEDYPHLILTTRTGRVGELELLPDGTGVIGTGEDTSGQHNLWRWPHGKPIMTRLWEHDPSAKLLALSADSRLAAARHRGQLELWELAPPRRRWSVPEPGGSWPVGFNLSRAELLLVDDGGSVHHLDLATGRERYVSVAIPRKVQGDELDASGNRVLLRSHSPTAASLYDTSSHEMLGTSTVVDPTNGIDGPVGQSDNVFLTWPSASQLVAIGTRRAQSPRFEQDNNVSRVWSPDGTWLAMASDIGVVDVFDLLPGFAKRSLRHGGTLSTVRSDARGRLLLSVAGDLRIWDVASGRAIGPAFETWAPWAARVAATANAVVVATVEPEGWRVWSFGAPAPLNCPRIEGAIGTAAISADGRVALTGRGSFWDDTGTYSHTVFLDQPGSGEPTAAQAWELPSMRPLGTPLRSEGVVRTVALNGDGSVAATGAADHTLRLWTTATGAPLGEPICMASDVLAIEFSPSGKEVLAADAAGWIEVRSVAGLELSRPRFRHAAGIVAATFDPKGERILAGYTWKELPSQLTSRFGDREDSLLSLRRAGAVAISADGDRTALVDDGDLTVGGRVPPHTPQLAIAARYGWNGWERVVFVPDRSEIAIVSQRWLHRYSFEGRPIGSRYLPSQFLGGIRFPREAPGWVELTLSDPCQPVRIVRLSLDLEDVAPIEGDPKALRENWGRRLGIPIAHQSADAAR